LIRRRNLGNLSKHSPSVQSAHSSCVPRHTPHEQRPPAPAQCTRNAGQFIRMSRRARNLVVEAPPELRRDAEEGERDIRRVGSLPKRVIHHLCGHCGLRVPRGAGAPPPVSEAWGKARGRAVVRGGAASAHPPGGTTCPHNGHRAPPAARARASTSRAQGASRQRGAGAADAPSARQTGP